MPFNPPFAVTIYTIQFTSFVRIAAGLYTFGTLIDLICLHKSSNCMNSSTTHSTAIYSFYPFFLLLRCDTFRDKNITRDLIRFDLCLEMRLTGAITLL